ncbi:uncharacterized protein SPPG_05663 [Spizellomyces punctatus DAOM BR117]|uniref:Serine aminopeptidase S33 domain-containing protein n=1 Tax=Spizellomyces punctatus (strain DAOM BR117) TaxID=645134 RepID=A0A0L0HE89_SPIPD|nr:uncharacterized protein SPPG_05663 [Spizellomyces punctatus DAOM BR117]KNC99422.1 hypothetical protein SPPG_05663 [Spizellomyces punctatus DAOM BR117]|eukprot:XP_016607462.1 hypothetical protein SPPG_05663 [Spizellomyces punctatus DAOM BR117]
MGTLLQLLEPLSAAASSAFQTVSHAAESLTKPAVDQSNDGPLPTTPSNIATSIPQRSSSLPPADDDDSSDTEQYDIAAKVPSLGVGWNSIWQFLGGSEELSDDECPEEVELKDLSNERGDPTQASKTETNKDEIIAVQRAADAAAQAPSGWAAFGFNLNIPMPPFLDTRSFPAPPDEVAPLPGLTPASNTAPEQGTVRSTTPDGDATTAASAWTKAWASVTGSATRNLRPCGHRHPFHFLEGDLVLMGGMYGSFLEDRSTGRREWLSMDAVLNWNTPDLRLPLGGDEEDDRLVPSGIFDRLGPINVCADLVREFVSWEKCSSGAFRFHPFAYDWRKSPHHASKSLETFLSNIYERNNHQKILLVAHSMGGLVALSVINRRPELFRGVVFVGTPFGSVPLIIWALRRGAPFMLNRTLMSAGLHFGARTSFVFLPTDGKGLVDDKEEDILIDFYNADEWLNYRLSQVFHTAKTQEDLQSFHTYLKQTLHSAKTFRTSLSHNPDQSYPPFATVTSTKFPTPTRIRSSVRKVQTPLGIKREIKLMWPCRFLPGDGIVSGEDMRMPLGFTFSEVRSLVGHWGLLNDVAAIRKALKNILEEETKRSKPESAADNEQIPTTNETHDENAHDIQRIDCSEEPKNEMDKLDINDRMEIKNGDEPQMEQTGSYTT